MVICHSSLYVHQRVGDWDFIEIYRQATWGVRAMGKKHGYNHGILSSISWYMTAMVNYKPQELWFHLTPESCQSLIWPVLGV